MSLAYKWLGGRDGLSSVHGGSHEWVVGKWVSVQTPVVPCQRGIHLCVPDRLVSWCAPALWVAEYDGETVVQADKIVVERARVVRRIDAWDEQSARLFAADCAERALVRERDAGREPDARSWAAVAAARAYARGEITAAARTAAWAAARYAALDAAWDAAFIAALDSATSAAADAAWAAAWDAERAWQRDHLLAMLGPTAHLDWRADG